MDPIRIMETLINVILTITVILLFVNAVNIITKLL